jgi:hypothetical protein
MVFVAVNVGLTEKVLVLVYVGETVHVLEIVGETEFVGVIVGLLPVISTATLPSVPALLGQKIMLNAAGVAAGLSAKPAVIVTPVEPEVFLTTSGVGAVTVARVIAPPYAPNNHELIFVVVTVFVMPFTVFVPVTGVSTANTFV